MGHLAPPTGTVTFLFTDVEGSTKLLHELGPETYAEALAEHRRLIREACGVEGGVEVDTQGDAFFFAFPTAPGALAAAEAITTSLAAGPIQVRVGLHTGTALLTDEGYIGDDVHFAARVASSGHGGQVILSRSTAELVELELTDLGEHRLKDIPEAVAIFQLGDGSFPPLKTTSNTNLPTPASSFVGRDDELLEVLSRFEEGARLVTLTGPGGTGKTRLAIEAAATLVPEYKAGVFWVGLATLRDPALVTETIAQTLGAKDGLADHIRDREMLLLLDNLEQVIDCAPELSEVLSACPDLKLLVTSRELLRVQGEVEYAVPPLAEAEAVSLFCARSQLEPDETIAELCRRLDDMPLAVELAAARTNVLTPEQIVERLSQRLDLLKGGRDADPRQQTLRATIEWSYELLSNEEKQLFARLSVFAGGCTLEAAEEVCDADLDTLQSLVEKSLLRFTDGRYWLLETIREYAAELLAECGEGDELGLTHAHFFARVAEDAYPSPARTDVVVVLARDEGNLRTALSFAGNGREPELMVRLAGALWRFWWVRDQDDEGRRWLDEAIAYGELAPAELRARALRGLGVITDGLGDHVRGRALEEDALDLYRQLGDDEGIATCLNNLGSFALEADDLERATTLLEEAVDLFDQIDGPSMIARTNLGQVAVRRGDLANGRKLYEEALAGAESENLDLAAADVRVHLAWIAALEDRFEEAAGLVREALSGYVQVGGSLDEAQCMLIAALVLDSRGSRADAARLVGAAHAERGRFGRPEALPTAYAHLFEEMERGFGQQRYAALRAEGAALDFDVAIAFAQRALD